MAVTSSSKAAWLVLSSFPTSTLSIRAPNRVKKSCHWEVSANLSSLGRMKGLYPEYMRMLKRQIMMETTICDEVPASKKIRPLVSMSFRHVSKTSNHQHWHSYESYRNFSLAKFGLLFSSEPLIQRAQLHASSSSRQRMMPFRFSTADTSLSCGIDLKMTGRFSPFGDSFSFSSAASSLSGHRYSKTFFSSVGILTFIVFIREACPGSSRCLW
mmetsp:Transcript_4356/g.8184  ORF Transcript_4356/g.8184 Transcript_4356/m.8184 type:complete len:213 (-) Transcript_4356:3673-4311(-)